MDDGSPFPWRIGVNMSAPTQIESIRAMLVSGAADYVELLMDNFISCDPASIRQSIGDVPIAFHVMGSNFISRDSESLRPMAARLREFIEATEPIYVSDHLAVFEKGGLLLPVSEEVDYDRLSDIASRVAFWQELLGVQLWLENHPSLEGNGSQQPDFMSELSRHTGCGVLFDISNALVAHQNGGCGLSSWNRVIQNSPHFHVGGYSIFMNSLRIDSHDRTLAEEAKEWVSSTAALAPFRQSRSITVEFDHNIDYSQWTSDLVDIRRLLSST